MLDFIAMKRIIPKRIVPLLLFALTACQNPFLPEPDMIISNSSLSLTTATRVFELTVRNTGERASVLEWEAVGAESLLISPPSGVLARGESQSVSVTVNRAAVASASRAEEKVTFESNGGDKSVYVTFSLPSTGLGPQ